MHIPWKSALVAAFVLWALPSCAQEPQWTGNEKLRCATQGGSACEIILNEVRSVFIVPYSDGTRDMTTTLQRCVDAGKICQLQTNGIYKITSSIVVSAAGGGGFVSDGSATIYMPAANFNNTDLTIKYTSNACGIYIHGNLSDIAFPLVGFTINGIKIQSEVSDGRAVSAICGRNIKNIDIEHTEIFGFPVGAGIRLGSLSGKSTIAYNNIHDFTSNSVWPAIPQITGIEIDGDRINSPGAINSTNVQILYNTIKDITLGTVNVTTWGYQTDGINNQGSGGTPVAHALIHGNNIENVGEGIDNFASEGVISDNKITNALGLGIKLIHSASNNDVHGNVVDGCGISCIAPGDGASGDTANNHIHGNVLMNPDQLFMWGTGGTNTVHASPQTTSCIRIFNNGGAFTTPNTLIEDNYCTANTYGMYNFIADGSTTGTVFKNNHSLTLGTVGYFSGSGGVSFKPAVPTFFQATTTAFTITNADGIVKIPFSTVIADARSEFNVANTRWTAQYPETVRVAVVMRFVSVAATFEFKPNIAINGSNNFSWQFQIAQAGEATFIFTKDIAVTAGQYLEVTAALTDTGTRTLTTGNQFTSITISQVQ